MEANIKKIIDAAKGKMDDAGHAQLEHNIYHEDMGLLINGVCIFGDEGREWLFLYGCSEKQNNNFTIACSNPLYPLFVSEICTLLDAGFGFLEPQEEPAC